jgi:hypothetical protein
VPLAHSPTPQLRVLSLGAGVQSTTVLAHVEKGHPYLPRGHHIAVTLLFTAAISVSLWQLGGSAGATGSFFYAEQRAWQIANDGQNSDDSLVGYWKFDETSAGSFTDSSGDGNTGTGNGATGTNNTPQPEARNRRPSIEVYVITKGAFPSSVHAVARRSSDPDWTCGTGGLTSTFAFN